jgi:VanZ family protein
LVGFKYDRHRSRHEFGRFMKGLTNLLALVVYALWLYALSLSLYPFTFDFPTGGAFWSEIEAFVRSGVSWKRFSFSTEVFCFVVSSYLLCTRQIIQYPSSNGILTYGLCVLALHMLLAVGLEVLQIFFPPRSVLLTDVICLSLGSALGVVLGYCGSATTVFLKFLGAQIESEGAILIRIILGLWVGLVFYWSFFPFEFRPRESGYLKEAFAEAFRVTFSPQDSVLNAIMGVPIGFLGTVGLYRSSRLATNTVPKKGTRHLQFWIVPLAGGVIVSLVAEFGQMWFVDRVPSLGDCVMQSVGCLLGSVVARNTVESMLPNLEFILSRLGSSGWIERLKVVWITTFSVASLSPFFPELDRSDIKSKLTDVLSPLQTKTFDRIGWIEASMLDGMCAFFLSMIMTAAIISNRIISIGSCVRLLVLAVTINLPLMFEALQLCLKERTTSILLLASTWIGELFSLALWSSVHFFQRVFRRNTIEKRKHGIDVGLATYKDHSMCSGISCDAMISVRGRLGYFLYCSTMLLLLILIVPLFSMAILRSGAGVAFLKAHSPAPIQSSLAFGGLVFIVGIAPWFVANFRCFSLRTSLLLTNLILFAGILCAIISRFAINQHFFHEIVGQSVWGIGDWVEGGVRWLSLFFPWFMCVSLGLKIGMLIDKAMPKLEWIISVLFALAAVGLFYEVAILHASTPYLLDILRGSGRDLWLVGQISLAVILTGVIASLCLTRFLRGSRYTRMWAAFFLPVICVGQWLVCFLLMKQTISVNPKGQSLLNRLLSLDTRFILNDQETLIRGIGLFACMSGFLVVCGLVSQGLSRFSLEIWRLCNETRNRHGIH